jgi:MerR family mercuric resistance operon transcriptional regulator
MNEKLTIGKLATRASVGVETIRFYEKKGLLTQPSKTTGFRTYPESYIKRIRFIKRSQELGFTLKETADLLDLKLDQNSTCSDVLVRTQDKITQIEDKIADLKRMKKSLEGLADCCESESDLLSECPLMDCFIGSDIVDMMEKK